MKFNRLFPSLLCMMLAVPVFAESTVSTTETTPGLIRNQAEILDVFSAEDQGSFFRAYLVQWRESKVIVSDPLGTTEHKKGETITFLTHRIEMPSADKPIQALQFVAVDTGLPSAQNSKVPKMSRQEKLQGEGRFCELDDLAKEALSCDNYGDARAYAKELATLALQYTNHWNYGGAIQNANMVLGHLALREGNTEAAKEFLLQSANSDGGPRMNSFGPNMSLAKALLEHGEREVVIQYLHRCKGFWRSDRGRLDNWIELIEKGEMPKFGRNLRY